MGNLLNKIFSFKKDLLRKDQSVVGIDIGSSFIKVIQIKKQKGKMILETYGSLAAGPYVNLAIGQATNLPPEKISEALNDLMTEANVTSRNAALSIPMKSTLLSLIEMPAMDPKQLSKMVPLEARKYIPVPISEVALDWQIIPNTDMEEDGAEKENTSEKYNILIVAIHNDAITKYQEIVKQSNLQSTFFEVEVFSNIRSTFSHDMTSTMVLDMGAGSTKLSIVERGVVKSFHTINRGSQAITLALSKSLSIDIEKAEEIKRDFGLIGRQNDKNISEIVKLSIGYIFDETNRVLLNYQRKYNKTISKVILTGGGVLLKGFLDEATQRLETDVIYGDPFAKIEAPAFLEPVLKEAGPEFSVAMGLALRKLQEME